MQPQAVLEQLHASLDSRHRPEDIADLILEGFTDDLTQRQRVILDRAAKRSVRRRRHDPYMSWWAGSSMTTEFARPADASRQIATLARLFDHDDDFTSAVADPSELRRLASTTGERIGWQPGHTNFKTDRLDRDEREAQNIDLPKRQYNRRFRFLVRLSAKIERMDAELRKRELMLVGRSGLASDITLGHFLADPKAACFVAYFVARKNLRREFSLSGKENPYDEIADMLFQRLDTDADWWMVSRAQPTAAVVARLTPQQQGELLGRWSALMRGAADILRQAWDPSVDRETMIVRRGMDSSTWNTIAQAFNTARSGWINALAANGALSLLDVACPGKVMRLMAADLAYWHRSSGSDVDPDTKVWATLPLPWEVLSGDATCTRATIEATCQDAGVAAAERGWTAPRQTGPVAVFRPTPELVHGVSVADPLWAGLLRRAGVFSGKSIGRDYVGLMVPSGVVTSDLPAPTHF